MNLGKNIKNARLNNHLSQKELADKITLLAKELGYDNLSYGNTAISNWESGTSKPDADTIFLICKALNVDANYLLDWDVRITITSAKDNLKKILKENKLFDSEDLTDENIDKIIKFINTNRDFIIEKKD